MVRLRLVGRDDRPVGSDEPRPHECVACFVDRMTRTHGCDNGLTWAVLWRDRCAPRATALERKLRSRGGFCDCEVLVNVYARPQWLGERPAVAAEWVEEESDGEPPRCLGVRKGSTQACGHWHSPY